jgi:CotH kinase protein
MPARPRLPLPFLFLVALAACGSNADSDPLAEGTAPVGGHTNTSATTDDELFDPERMPRFEIELPPESITALAENPKVYARGNFRYGTEVVTNVGVKFKGEATLRTLLEKPSFKIKFDEFVPDQVFRGLKRITLNNLVEDRSFISERLAYDFFRAAKLPAPRANNAVVLINGTLLGLYSNVESEDKTFLRRWFKDDSGNLYEENAKDFLPGQEVAFELETNEKRNDRSDLAALIAAVTNANDATLLTDLDTQMDVTQFLRFTAAEAIVNQWDMYGYTRFHPNNFRIYRDPSVGKFVFLPWGMDMAWKAFLGMAGHIKAMELAHAMDNPADAVTSGIIFQRCLRSDPCRVRYVEILREMLALYDSLNMVATAERYHNQIVGAGSEDPRKEFDMIDFIKEQGTVLRTLRERSSRIRAELGN